MGMSTTTRCDANGNAAERGLLERDLRALRER
jgi:hypothetical protein